MIDITPDPIFRVACGFMASKYLFVATEIALFEKLADGPATLDELSHRIGLPRRTVRIIVDAMVSLDFLECQSDRYQNGPIVATFLSGRTPADLRALIRFWNRLSYPNWMRLEEGVRTGHVTWGELTEEQQQIYSEGVEAITAAPAQVLATTYDFSQHRKVLDLGGGTGSFLVAILSKYNTLETTLFDFPHVAALARQRLTGKPMEKHIAIIEGDILKDPIPEHHDAVIVANVVHQFSPGNNIKLLQRIRNAVPDGARLLLVDIWTDPTHTQPHFAALMAGEFMLATGQGDVYSAKEVSEWLQKTGWRSIMQLPLVGPASLIVAETAI